MDKDYFIVKHCEECDAIYKRSIQPTEDELEDYELAVNAGVYTISETDDEICFYQSFFICPDCEQSTFMDQTDNEKRSYQISLTTQPNVLNKYRKS